jgi:hypothetical protein
MSTIKLLYPGALKNQLRDKLPRDQAGQRPAILITPRSHDHRRCAAYEADYYEVQAYYVNSSLDLLGPLERALRAIPGVYSTTWVCPAPPEAGRPLLIGNTFTNPAWPAELGVGRRGWRRLRVQVIALIRDPEDTGRQRTPADSARFWLAQQHPAALTIARELIRRQAGGPAREMYESGVLVGLSLALSYHTDRPGDLSLTGAERYVQDVKDADELVRESTREPT